MTVRSGVFHMYDRWICRNAALFIDIMGMLLTSAGCRGRLFHVTCQELYVALRDNFHALCRCRDEDGLAFAESLRIALRVCDCPFSSDTYHDEERVEGLKVESVLLVQFVEGCREILQSTSTFSLSFDLV